MAGLASRLVRASFASASLRRGVASTVAPLRLEPQLESIITRFQTSIKASRAGLHEDKSKALVSDFGQLQRVRVQNVLLVCSDYDSYTFEEEGLLNELVFQWYADHSLSKPPIIDRVSSPELAIMRFKERPYDMVITLARLVKQSNLIREINHHKPATPIAVLALNGSELVSLSPQIDKSLRLNINKRLSWERAKEASSSAAVPAVSPVTSSIGLEDAWVWPFMWQGKPELFTAMFKAVEDRLNVKEDGEYGVQTILVVEDSVQFYSAFLPVLYSEIWRQNKSLQTETMHVREQLLRMHSRPKLLFCTNYEEAIDVYDRYQGNLLGVITDLGFPKEGVHFDQAGMHLLAHIKERTPELPVLMQSARAEDSEEAETARSLGVDKYVCKRSPLLLTTLREYMTEDLMFGPLKFMDGEGSKMLGQVSNVTELLKMWEVLPPDSVAYHGRRSDLSRWFFARAEFQLAKRFRQSQYPTDFIDSNGKERPDWLRNWILCETRAHRNKLASTVENAQTADATTPIVRLGTGSLGGKGRGFRFLHSLAEKFNMATVIPDLELVVPQCFVLATSIFDDFMASNELLRPALEAASDQEVEHAFESAQFTIDVNNALRKYLENNTGPLAVRSSSLFEDAFMQPFAGIYHTVMVPNVGDDLDERLECLQRAIKRVYASTYSHEAKAYSASMQNRTEEEKMAVILQPVVGMGLGSTVVDGCPAIHFSLGDASKLNGPDPATLPVTALDLNKGNGASDELVVSLPCRAAEALVTVPKARDVQMAPEAAQVVPGLTTDVHGGTVVFQRKYGAVVTDGSRPETPGLKSVGLAHFLGGEAPITKALSFLLRLGQAGLGCPVELEFALQARKDDSARHQLHLLQIRPQAQYQLGASDRFTFLPGSQYAAVASKRALGHGRIEGITDVVYVSPSRFAKDSTQQIASEIRQVNMHLGEVGRKYLLMAPGRWGSADAQRGIPVAWQDIDQSALIVETALDSHVPLSQGSHFMQNIISFGLGYMTVDLEQERSSEVADYAFWDTLPEVAHGTSYVRHATLSTPLEIVFDGRSCHGVVMKPGMPFDVYVGQVDAFMQVGREESSAIS